MVRRLAPIAFVSVLSALVLSALAAPVAARTAEAIADQVDFRGYYIQEGLDVSVEVMEELVDAHPDVGFVALAGDLVEGADLAADQILAAVEEVDTVIVLSETDAGIVSAVFDDDALDVAADAAFATTGDSYEIDFEQMAEALPAQPGSTTQPAATPGRAGGFPLITVLLVAVVVAFVWMRLRSRKRAVADVQARVDTAKAEIRRQMVVIADEILEFSDRPDQDTNPAALEHYRKASDVYKGAEERLDTATGEPELEALSDDLDEARWELAAAEAILEGRPVPPKPEESKPEPCFFDPTHGAGVEEAQLQTATGTRTVMVCRADAERMRRGERPQPRTIDVGGRSVPAPRAPRTHGGRGMDWLDAFSILVGGMGQAMDYRMGGRRRSGGWSSGGGGLGIPLPSRSRSTSRSGSRSPSRSSSASRTVGRTRRSR